MRKSGSPSEHAVWLKSVMATLSMALIDRLGSDSPVRELAMNKFLLHDIMDLLRQNEIEHLMISGGYGERSTEIYTIASDSWIRGPDMPHDRFNHRTALVDIIDSHGLSTREVFVIGGCSRGETTNSVIALDVPPACGVDSMRWTQMPSMVERRHSHGVAVVDGNVYVVGGYNGTEYLRSCEVYSVSSGQWNPGAVPQMTSARCNMGVAVVGKRIFVVGGENDKLQVFSSVEVLDTETNEWSVLAAPPMKTARSAVGVTVVDDRYIWVLGGFNLGSLGSVEVYDSENGTWSTSTIELTPPQSCLCAVAVDHKIFTVSCSAVNGAVKILDVDTSGWLDASQMMIQRINYSVIGF